MSVSELQASVWHVPPPVQSALVVQVAPAFVPKTHTFKILTAFTLAERLPGACGAHCRWQTESYG